MPNKILPYLVQLFLGLISPSCRDQVIFLVMYYNFLRMNFLSEYLFKCMTSCLSYLALKSYTMESDEARQGDLDQRQTS